jgi:hyperosmotically inducible protein
MNISRWWIPVMLVGAVLAGSACTQKSEDEAGVTVDKPNADSALDATRDEAASIAEETKEAAGEVLKGSSINVDTKDHVVTLKGTMGSDAAKARAVEIARNTEGVVRVVNQLVVK